MNVYSKISFAAAGANLLVNLGIGALLLARSPYFLLLAADNIFFTGFLSMTSLGLGIHAVVRFKWPGDTVYDRAHRPRGRDLALVGLSALLTAVNLAALAWHLWVAGEAVTVR